MATLTELTTPLTPEEIEKAIFDALEARGVQTTTWKPGAIARTIISGAAIVMAAFSSLQQRIAESGFLGLAEEDWLTIVAKEVYNVERDVGTFATGKVTLDNTGGGVYVVAIGDLTVSNSTSGKTYRNTAAFTLDAFETGEIVPVQAVELGADSTSAAGFIDTLETVLLGVTVTNPAALVGLDEESDESLRTRSLAKTGTLSPNGPADAYRFLALSAETDDGTPAGVTRVTTIPDGEGNVSVIVATASGPVTGTVGDTSTPLGAVDETIQTQAVPLAVTATISSAISKPISVTYEAFVRTTVGLTSAELLTNIATALSTYISQQPIGGSRKVPGGGFVFTTALESVIGEAVGTEQLVDVDLALPTGDVVIGTTEAPVAAFISGTIIFMTV